MAISRLATNSVKTIYGTTLAGIGLSIGRRITKSPQQFLVLMLLFGIGLGGIVFSFKSGRIMSRWHPTGWGRWLFTTFLKVLAFGTLGYLLMLAIVFVVGLLFMGLFVPEVSDPNERMEILNRTAGSLMAIVWWIGVFRGLFERGKRRSAHKLAVHNQSKLDDWGLTELDGGDITHKDAEGNMLSLQNVGADLIEFSIKGQPLHWAYIEVGEGGKFDNYSGIVGK